MTPERHMMMAERIARAMRKLTPADYELVIEAAMLAGSHWFNAAAHRYGLTRDEDDVMHVEYLPGALRTKISLVAPRLTELLEQIEGYRPLFVKGDAHGGEAAASQCLNLLDELRTRASNAKRPAGLNIYSISTKGLSYIGPGNEADPA